MVSLDKFMLTVEFIVVPNVNRKKFLLQKISSYSTKRWKVCEYCLRIYSLRIIFLIYFFLLIFINLIFQEIIKWTIINIGRFIEMYFLCWSTYFSFWKILILKLNRRIWSCKRKIKSQSGCIEKIKKRKKDFIYSLFLCV